jgi:nucleoid-associated protein EbfC
MPKMPNMNQIMRMAQDMSKKMEDRMDAIEVEGNAGGGMVKVTMNGHKNMTGCEIAAEVVDPEEIDMLQDLVVAAVNDALHKVDDQLKDSMGGIPGMPAGFSIPGL